MIKKSIREYCSVIDSNYEHYDVVTIFDAVTIAGPLSNPLRPSAGLCMKNPVMLILSLQNSRQEVRYWVDYIIKNLNRGLSDNMTEQLAEYKKHGYCTNSILSEVLSLMKIQAAVIDSKIFVDAIWTEVKGYVKQSERKQPSKYNF